MCCVIALSTPCPDVHWVVAANRDEDPDRPSAPPGLDASGGRLCLCPRDKRAGGTWIGVNDAGLVAALTNAPGPVPHDPPSRGLLTLAALAGGDCEEAAARVGAALRARAHAPFRLLLLDQGGGLVLEGGGRRLARRELAAPSLVLTDLHGPGEVRIPELERWLAARPEVELDALLDHLLVTLATGLGVDSGGAFPLRRGEGARRTVSATLIAVGAGHPEGLRFLYVPGDPLEGRVRDYSGLAGRFARGRS